MKPEMRQKLAREPFAERVHVLELPGRVDVQERERHAAGVEGLARQVREHRRVLPDRVEHDRVAELGRHLADDVDRLRLEGLEVGQRG